MVKTMTAQKKLNKILSAAGILLCTVCVLMMSVLPVSAVQDTGSLTLRCVYTVEGGVRVLPNDEYSLVKIADAVMTDSSVVYHTRDQFDSFDCDWKNMPSSSMNEKAKDLAEFCEDHGYYAATRTTDGNGELKFEDLEFGLYLVARTKVDAVNEDFITDPLLVFLPQKVNGKAVYDIVASPKFSYLHGDTPGDPSLPQTGLLIWPIAPLAVIGCLLILSGVFLRKKVNSDEK